MNTVAYLNESDLRVIISRETNDNMANMYNPSVIGPWTSFNFNGWRRNPGMVRDWTKFMDQSRVILLDTRTLTLSKIMHGAEDMRLVNFNQRRFGVFTRYKMRQRKHPWLACFDPSYREIELKHNHMRNSEGNWLPFVWNETMYASYSICPHRVLNIHVESGQCDRVYETKLAGCDHSLRGGSSGVEVNSTMWLGMAHTRHGMTYAHYLFIRKRAPPFSILNISNAFALKNTHGVRDNNFVTSLTRNETHLHVLSGCQDSRMELTSITLEWFCKFTKWCQNDGGSVGFF